MRIHPSQKAAPGYFYPMPASASLLSTRPVLRLGIPALAAGQGFAEAGFILAARQGLTGGGPVALAAMAACVLLRFFCQDRGAAFEARALRESSAALRGRLLGALRARAVPAYRPEVRHALDQALTKASRAPPRDCSRAAASRARFCNARSSCRFSS